MYISVSFTEVNAPCPKCTLTCASQHSLQCTLRNIYRYIYMSLVCLQIIHTCTIAPLFSGNGDLSCFLIHWRCHHFESHSLDRNIPFASEACVSHGHLLLHYTNSALMFFFILCNFSIIFSHTKMKSFTQHI